MADATVRMFLGGDVMPGRGLDQILPHPGNPALREAFVRDARGYVTLAERVHGPIPRPVGFAWPWGDALATLAASGSDVRVLNLECGITTSDEFAPDKSVHYRMHPANLPFLGAVRPDVCALANNHVLDFGRQGLLDMLDALDGAGLAGAGAGRDLAAASRPVVIVDERGDRVMVFSCGLASSGVPADWAATADRPGVWYLPDASQRSAETLAARIRAVKRPGDIVVVSVHWGSNWGYEVSAAQVAFAHRLVEAGVDVVHGHSSHHPRPIEAYRDRLILYGCGDLIDDYEGVAGYEYFRDDLRLLYFASLRPGTGALVELRMVPMRVHAMRLHHASQADADWLRERLEKVSRPFGTHIALDGDRTLMVRGR